MFKHSVNTNGLRRKHTPPQIAELVKKAGAEGIEWGLPALDEAGKAVREMDRLTRDAGLEVAGYINGGKMWKLEEMKRWTEVVASVGGRSLRVSHPWIAWDYAESLRQKASYPEIFAMTRAAMPELARLSESSGVRFLLELHCGALTASPLAAARLFDGFNPKHFGIIYDPANTMMEGGMRPRSEVEVLGKFLAYVHAKNMAPAWDGQFHETPVRRAKWAWKQAPLSDGMLDWLEVMFALKTAGFQGWISSEEYFQNGDNPLEQIRDGIAFLKDCERHAPARPQEPFTTFND